MYYTLDMEFVYPSRYFVETRHVNIDSVLFALKDKNCFLILDIIFTILDNVKPSRMSLIIPMTSTPYSLDILPGNQTHEK